MTFWVLNCNYTIMDKETQKDSNKHSDSNLSAPETVMIPQEVEEIGGRKGPEPTRYGDWEKNGRCMDF